MEHPNGKSKMNDIIKTTLENMKTIVESNTIIGDPIETTGGVVVIPVSKVSLGFASGGLDYASKKEEVKPSAAKRAWALSKSVIGSSPDPAGAIPPTAERYRPNQPRCWSIPRRWGDR